jgi:MFS family permease
VLIVVPDPTEKIVAATPGTGGVEVATARAGSAPDAGRTEAKERTAGLFRTIVSNRTVLLRMGTCAALISALRSSRTVILPLAAVAIGMSAANTALIIGIAGAVDFALFYTSGQIMDRFGRLWSALPSMLGLSVTHIALAFVSDQTWFTVVAIAMAVANGVGSGILMTLGADLAPRTDPAPFLGAWRFTNDAGQAGAPLFVSAVTGLFSLAAASVSMGVLGLIGAGMLVRYVPKFVPRRRPAAAR